MDDLRLSLGFVPQMDVLIRELSLRENILHSALTRLPRSVSRAEAEARVDELLGGLNLSRVADSLVGETSGSTRGVSGGERKRVSIAVELVADPLVLFLDEPTTGLDATTALSAMVALRSLAQQRGLTCFAVIHQPRQEIIEAIDDIILLGRGGRPIFLGPRDLAISYICDALGYELPELCSPADFLLDVASGKHGLPRLKPASDAASDGSKGDAESQVASVSKYSSSNDNANPGVVAIVEALATAWRGGGERWVQQRSSIVPYSSLVTVHDASAELWSKQIREKLRKPRRNALEQTLLHALRATRQRFRGTSLMIDLFSMLLGGFVAGIVLSGGDLIIPNAPLQYFQSCPPSASVFCNSPLRSMYQPATFYVTMIFAVLSIAPAVRLFGAEREVAWREAGVGIPAGSYFLGKLLAELPVWALMALNVSASLAAVAPLRGPYGGFFSLAMATIVFCSALGIAISAIFGTESDKANLSGVILATVLNLAGGFVPMLGKGAVWAYTHWTARAFVAIELNAGYGITEPMFRWITNDEWDVPNWPRDIGVICLFSVLTFALAFVISVKFHSDKRR
jgi:ABC-type multidrug transport system ATPase subunit